MIARLALEDQRKLAQARYPAEWAEALRMTGKRRQNRTRALRDRAVYEASMAQLPAGAQCGSCQHFDPVSPCPGIGSHCELDTDFHGYAIVDASHVCPRWSA